MKILIYKYYIPTNISLLVSIDTCYFNILHLYFYHIIIWSIDIEMRHFYTLLLAFATYAFHIALGYGLVEERAPPGFMSVERRDQTPSASLVEARDQTLSANEVDLSLIQLFEPWPGYFLGKGSLLSRGLHESAEKRGPESDEICLLREPLAGSMMWKPSKARCDIIDPLKKRFFVDCEVPGTLAQSWDHPGHCRGDTMCIEFQASSTTWGYNMDINCRSRDVIRQWAIDASDVDGKGLCSPAYANKDKSKKAMKMSLQTNVMDRNKENYVSPDEVYYEMDGKRIGNHKKRNGIVESGLVRVPWGSRIKASITPSKGQVVTVIVALTALILAQERNRGKARPPGHGGELALTDRATEFTGW